jgi:acetyltransferase-like isoleucine patch superfamily enzyme
MWENIFKNQLSNLTYYIKSERRKALLEKEHPSCIIGREVFVDSLSSLGKFNVFFDNVSIVDSRIGDHSYFQKNAMITASNIGKYCSIAGNTAIGLPQHEIDLVSSHPVFYLKNTPLARKYCRSDHGKVQQRVDIGNDVWVGYGAMIMSGVTVGTGAIIGAGSIVTKDVPPYAIVVGAPARLLRYRFDEGLINRLLASKWWEMSDNWLEAHVDQFLDPIRLLATLDGYEGKQ